MLLILLLKIFHVNIAIYEYVMGSGPCGPDAPRPYTAIHIKEHRRVEKIEFQYWMMRVLHPVGTQADKIISVAVTNICK
jgi:hypothetical protein